MKWNMLVVFTPSWADQSGHRVQMNVIHTLSDITDPCLLVLHGWCNQMYAMSYATFRIHHNLKVTVVISAHWLVNAKVAALRSGRYGIGIYETDKYGANFRIFNYT